MDTAQLELHSHYRLADKPIRTLEALRLFLPGQAEVAYEALRRGERVVVRRGSLAAVEQLALAMQAQGFQVKVRRGALG